MAERQASPPKLMLYNTLKRKKEVFEPIDANNVRMYVCGPTVYDFAHIGNARPAIVFDVLFRLLRHQYGADHVTYVRNITDVDDKINARALRDFPDLPLNEAIREVTEKTTRQYHADMKALGCLEPTFEPRATEHIEGMVKMIGTLIDKGHAYVAKTETGSEVLFDISSMADYGRLSNRKIDDQKAGARVATSSHKKNPGDFVLWKLSSSEEPGWQSPWGRGRPGWHLECSVMSEHHLGKVFDIHGGGLDLIFPHHENELAQSRCVHGTKVMANYWLHNGFLQVEGRKMSKSEGNFVTIFELVETDKFGKHSWPGEVLRLAMMMTNYREPVDFSIDKLNEAKNLLARFKRAVEPHVSATDEPSLDQPFLAALLDDLNTSLAIRRLSALAGEAFGTTHKQGIVPDKHTQQNAVRKLFHAAALIGLNLESQIQITSGEQWQIDQRLTLIAEKKWTEADAIRDELLVKGIQLKDGKDPETGQRITTWEVQR